MLFDVVWGIGVIVGAGVIGDGVGCMGVIVDFCDRRRRIETMRNRKNIIEPIASHLAVFPCRSQKVGLLKSLS